VFVYCSTMTRAANRMSTNDLIWTKKDSDEELTSMASREFSVHRRSSFSLARRLTSLIKLFSGRNRWWFIWLWIALRLSTVEAHWLCPCSNLPWKFLMNFSNDPVLWSRCVDSRTVVIRRAMMVGNGTACPAPTRLSRHCSCCCWNCHDTMGSWFVPQITSLSID